MEDVLKYQRLQGAVDSIVAKDRITMSAIEGNFLVIGTERGIIHILALTGVHIQRYTPHPGRSIRGLSLCYDGVLTIFSIAEDDDTVVVCTANSEDMRTTTYQFSETITAIAVDYTSAAYKNDGMILVGSQSGRLIKYRPSILFGKREKRVEDGKNSPVKAIAWHDNLVAWADDEGLYLFDIATKSAIGRVPTPCGPGDRDLYPVSIRWTDADQLLLGWAYTVTILKVKTSAEEGLLTEAGTLVLKVIHSWETDCVVAGVHAFDRDHVVYLGYSTISSEDMGIAEGEEEEEGYEDNNNNNDQDASNVQSASATAGGAAAQTTATRAPGANADLEVIVAKIQNGDIISADVLPLRGNLYLSQGPFQFQLLSTYDTRSLIRDPPHRQWQLHHYSEVRGGDQGKAPLLYISSPEDVVLGRVRDVNDRVRAALGHGDLKLAVEVAQYDRASLRVYGYADLLEGYISQLLDVNETTLAAKEIGRLAGMDAILWETWVYRFIKMGLLDYLCLELPIGKPRLERYIYEEVIDNLVTKHPEKLLPTLQTWSAKLSSLDSANTPNLYDREALIQRLERQLRQARRIAMAPIDAPLQSEDSDEAYLTSSFEDSASNDTHVLSNNRREDGILSSYRHTQEAKWRRQKRRDTRHAARHYFAALAHLHLLSKNYEKALNCYLHRLPRIATAHATAAALPPPLPPIVPATSKATGSGRTTSQARRETSVSTLTASESARQIQQEVADLDNEEVDFDLESEDDEELDDDRPLDGSHSPYPHLQDQQQQLYGGGGFSPLRERRKALDEHVQQSQNTAGAGGNNGGGNSNNSEHRHVFELIEHEHLFHNVAGKIRYLVRLSRPLCQRLLLSHLDKLPIGSVAAQLQSDKELLRWYLTALFADISARETYRAKEFANLHVKQLQLSIEHRARCLLQQHQQRAAAAAGGVLVPTPFSSSSNTANAAGLADSSSSPSSDLLNFLKAGWIAAPVALQEIESFLSSPMLMEMFALYSSNNNNSSSSSSGISPAGANAAASSSALLGWDALSPHQLLIEEKVYLLAMQGEKQSALRLLLETDDVDRVLYFLTVHGHGHAARYVSTARSSLHTSNSNSSFHEDFDEQYELEQRQLAQQREGQLLWEDVVRRGLESPSFLQVLVTKLGDSGMDGTVLLKRLTEHVEHIPRFGNKIQGVLSDWHTMENADRTCRALQQDEALSLLAQKNRRQRRAIKIEAKSSTLQRCTICLRPLGTEASPPALEQAMLLLSKGGAMEMQLPCAPSQIAVCGTDLAHSSGANATANATANAATAAASAGSRQSQGGHGHHHHAHGPSIHPLLFFNAKNAVHQTCFDAVVRAEYESKRVADESKEMLGGATTSVMEKRGMVARTQHTQLHR